LLARIREKQEELKSQQQDLEFMLLDLRNAEDKCLDALSEMTARKSVKVKT